MHRVLLVLFKLTVRVKTNTHTFQPFPPKLIHTHTGCLRIKIIVRSSLDDPSFNDVSVTMCKVIQTDRRSVPLYLSALRGRVSA